MFDSVRRGAPLMPKIVADPLSASCYRLFSRPGIPISQWVSSDAFLRRAHARARSFGAAWSGKSAGVRCNPYLNLAADSLQIAQTVKDGSMRDCNCAGVRCAASPDAAAGRSHSFFLARCLFLRLRGPSGAASKFVSNCLRNLTNGTHPPRRPAEAGTQSLPLA